MLGFCSRASAAGDSRILAIQKVKLKFSMPLNCKHLKVRVVTPCRRTIELQDRKSNPPYGEMCAIFCVLDTRLLHHAIGQKERDTPSPLCSDCAEGVNHNEYKGLHQQQVLQKPPFGSHQNQSLPDAGPLHSTRLNKSTEHLIWFCSG